MQPPTTYPNEFLIFDREGIRKVDAQAIDHYGMNGLVLMENAARGSAEIAFEMLNGMEGPPSVVIACGGGNNGGDGYAIARHIHNRNIPVKIVACGSPRIGTDAGINAAIANSMNIEIIAADEWVNTQCLIVDALLGTGLESHVKGPTMDMIDAINASGSPVLSVDVPSGLDSDTGKPHGRAVRASKTVTFVGMKTGLLEPDGQLHAGDISIVDIGIPIELARSLSLNWPGDRLSANSQL